MVMATLQNLKILMNSENIYYIVLVIKVFILLWLMEWVNNLYQLYSQYLSVSENSLIKNESIFALCTIKAYTGYAFFGILFTRGFKYFCPFPSRDDVLYRVYLLKAKKIFKKFWLSNSFCASTCVLYLFCVKVRKSYN